MKKTLLLTTLCTLGTLSFAFASPASADGGRHYDRHDRYERQYDRRHDRRVERRIDRRDDRRDYRRNYGRGDSRNYRPRYYGRDVVNGRYCDDRRHLHSVHYHVAPRDYYAYGYPRDAYRLHRSNGLDATLIVTLPLF